MKRKPVGVASGCTGVSRRVAGPPPDVLERPEFFGMPAAGQAALQEPGFSTRFTKADPMRGSRLHAMGIPRWLCR